MSEIHAKGVAGYGHFGKPSEKRETDAKIGHWNDVFNII
jgi:hypothetical protein